MSSLSDKRGAMMTPIRPMYELPSTLSLEVLNSSLVLLGLLASAKRAEVLSLAGLWVFLAGVESVLA